MTKSPRPSAAVRKVALLLNLGPKSASWLVAAGVTDLEKLRKLGPVVAYMKVQALEPNVSLNLLWALAGALEGCAWNALPEGTRASLLIELEARQETVHYRPPPLAAGPTKPPVRKRARNAAQPKRER